VLTDEEWSAGLPAWLPTDDDRAHVESLMTGVREPGKMAGWIAAPSTGIHQRPVDYDYVRL
jgi:benzoyl-CoA 2,3-dioxygenase component B